VSKSDILRELPKLHADERREIFEELCLLEEGDLLRGVGPSHHEKIILDAELKAFHESPGVGSPWSDVERRLRSDADRE